MKKSFDPNLYMLPRRERDPIGVIFPSIGIVIWVGAASCWVATQEVARAFGYQASLGRPLFGHAYSPFDLVAWAVKFDHPARFGLEIHRVFAHAYAVAVLGNAFGICVAVMMAARRLGRLQRHSDLHGSAHWASPHEVQATGLLGRDRGVYVGAWRDPKSGRIKYLRDASSAHELEFKATGAGKTVGSVILTLLSWTGSVFCLDLKGGEVWLKTAGWRAANREEGGLGQRVYKFEPAAISGSSVHLNPFDRVRIGTGYEIQDVQNIVELVADEGEKPARGDNRFWIEMAKRLLLGLSLHVKHDADPHNDSLTGVAAILADPRFDKVDGLFKHLRSYEHDASHARGWRDAEGRLSATHPLVAQIATQMLAMEERVKANVVAEAQSFLNLYSDPVIAANIASSDFNLDDVGNGDVSLYFVVHPADKKRLRPLTRLITTQVLLALMQRSEHVAEPRVLIMLEEVAELGALDVVATALALGRGYGLKLFLIAQDLSQLDTAWGAKSKTIVANCAIRIASAPNDVGTAELLSKMCGTMTVRHTVRNYSGSRLSALLPHTMTTEHDTQRPLLTPDEVMRLPGPRKTDTGEIVAPGNILVFVSGHPPIYGMQPLYFGTPPSRSVQRSLRRRCAVPEQLSLHDQLHVRLQEKLRRELGAAVLDALADPLVIEVMLNPDGRLWIDELGVGMRDTGSRISAAQAENLLGTVAATLGCVITAERPVLEGELHLDGSRFCGLLPPVVLAPAFCIRKAAVLVYGLDDYVRDGILDGMVPPEIASIDRPPSRGHAAVLRHAIRTRQNILVVGGTQSGKTTLANGLLHELSTSVGSTQRVLTIEETRELRCTVPNHVAMRTTETIDMTRLVRTALRLRPDRIIVGEVRGAEALAMLKAWNTGHPGGIATVHANDARAGLIRLEQLVQEANVPPQPALIAEAVDLIVVIIRTPTGRKITEMARVRGASASGYVLEHVEAAIDDRSREAQRHLMAA